VGRRIEECLRKVFYTPNGVRPADRFIGLGCGEEQARDCSPSGTEAPKLDGFRTHIPDPALGPSIPSTDLSPKPYLTTVVPEREDHRKKRFFKPAAGPQRNDHHQVAGREGPSM
jgi:hypothetical protein